MNDDFLYKDVPALGRRVFRLGLAANYGIEGADLNWALDNGINYVFWTASAKKVLPALRDALKRNRRSILLSSGPTFAYTAGGIRRGCARLLKKLGTDYLDVFQIFWLGRTSAWTQATVEALISLKQSGMAKTIGISIHDRTRAGALVSDSPLDLFMIRYNAAHTGAEQDIFPGLPQRRPAIVSYTATCWRALLRPVKGWEAPVMTATDCYRFCLSNEHVDIALTGPKNREQLAQNLTGLRDKGALSAEELQWMAAFGQRVHNASSRFAFGF